MYLKDIDPTIIQSMCYYADENFVGKKVEGYKAPEAILTIDAAMIIHLIIYDAYRPQKAVEHF
ncbi:D-alanyl-D-alanine dipeptidase [Rickettsia canadensis str. McKiel]|uniref:D-alanyl-D-alanine dipeptidase n=1 Tax=Rickettsia canadensis (strain McKiel) TaxID=293613 RepID=A8EXY3_RICCK|nr:peptidase M15 [Rickettsia canadensis]ABV73216.1 D-alanyl-D-alanine dipeptidase [Rickettsia canadensis str. McKiel]